MMEMPVIVVEIPMAVAARQCRWRCRWQRG
ncbi:hypothetical protein M2243_002804 [Heliophilum fasciatum]|nr:hypothetical protein [Heliophilum fasciatum]